MTRGTIDEPHPKRPDGRHYHPHPEGRLIIKAMHVVDRLYCRVYHDLTVLTPPKLPQTGPAILICNHTSSIDPLFIQSVLHRIVVWMMAKEYYDIRPMKPVFQTLEAIPVDRGARDTSAMRLAMRALQEGRLLGIFPEGRIETTPDLLPFQPGVAQLALKLKVPVYPCYLDGTQRGREMGEAFLRRNAVSIRFGPEVQLDRSANTPDILKANTQRLYDAVNALKNANPHRTFRQ